VPSDYTEKIIAGLLIFKCNVKPWELGMGCGKMVRVENCLVPTGISSTRQAESIKSSSIHTEDWDMGGKTCEL